MRPRVIFLVGPTAIGKTEISVRLAKRINTEIISCDSMQIYKGMEIISSQPPAALRKKIRHHLISIIAPSKDYNVAKYRQEALKKIREIFQRGKVPLFVGGTGLYMSTLIDGIFSANSENESVRRQLYQQAERCGSVYLYKRLQEADPMAALKIHPRDTKRIVRALEVFEVCGKPISQLQKERKGLLGEYEVKIFCLNLERSKLYCRIEKRIDKMFAQGLIREVKKLLKLSLSRTASCAIGIKELRGYFAGLYDLEAARRLMKRNTRHYAKRQLTWFRKDKRITWVEVSEKETPAHVANKILRLYNSKPALELSG